MSTPKKPAVVLKQAIMKHAGLSSYDEVAVKAEVKSIVRALKRHGYEIRRKHDGYTVDKG